MQAREFLSKLGDISQTQIFAKIENVEVSLHISWQCTVTISVFFFHKLILLLAMPILLYMNICICLVS